MVRKDNYLIQANQAKQHFLTYDQQRLIEKLNLQADENYLYIKFLCESYRLSRTTGSLERYHADAWVDANSFAEVMTILDLVCDSRENRYLSGRWKSMTDFGCLNSFNDSRHTRHTANQDNLLNIRSTQTSVFQCSFTRA